VTALGVGPRLTPVAAQVLPARGRSLVYIVGTYPLLTTTFIDREIRELQTSGVDVRVVAVRRPPVDVPLSRDQEILQRYVSYLLPVRWVSLISAHVVFAFRRPRRSFATLAFLLTRPHPSWRARLKSLLHFGEGVLVAHLVRGIDFDELHAHFADRAATIALVASRLLDKPYSLSIHAGADIFVRPVLLREKIQEARHVVTCTEHNRKHVLSIVGHDLRHKVSHVRHGLDLDVYPAATPRGDLPLILSVGQLAERKGFAGLIRALRVLSDEGYEFRCRIVGEGPQRSELEALVAELSLEVVVELCGALGHEQVIEEYSRATMFVLPCTRTPTGDVDGIPNVLAEAMASRLPVVTSDLPAIREIVRDRKSGLLVTPGDVTSLVTAIRRLLGDPELREELGRRGRGTVGREFEVETNVRRFAETMWPEWFEMGLRMDGG
jgi:colanic acid/amylovoran biosynthesis glycosyltransferase